MCCQVTVMKKKCMFPWWTFVWNSCLLQSWSWLFWCTERWFFYDSCTYLVLHFLRKYFVHVFTLWTYSTPVCWLACDIKLGWVATQYSYCRDFTGSMDAFIFKPHVNFNNQHYQWETEIQSSLQISACIGPDLGISDILVFVSFCWSYFLADWWVTHWDT